MIESASSVTNVNAAAVPSAAKDGILRADHPADRSVVESRLRADVFREAVADHGGRRPGAGVLRLASVPRGVSEIPIVVPVAPHDRDPAREVRRVTAVRDPGSLENAEHEGGGACRIAVRGDDIERVGRDCDAGARGDGVQSMRGELGELLPARNVHGCEHEHERGEHRGCGDECHLPAKRKCREAGAKTHERWVGAGRADDGERSGTHRSGSPPGIHA